MWSVEAGGPAPLLKAKGGHQIEGMVTPGDQGETKGRAGGEVL